MTTEVAVMNKQAVALAADSAGTVTLKEGEKIYFSENKLFALSKYQPVGIMIYGNADFMMVPFETIIKEYRKELGAGSFSSLKEYALDFIKFLEKPSNPIFPSNIQDLYVKFTVNAFINDVGSDLDEITDDDEKVKYVDRLNTLFIKESDLENKPKGKETKLAKKYKDIINDAVETHITSELSRDDITKIKKMCPLLFTKDFEHTNRYAGVVFAGYGNDDLFPSIESFKFYGITDGLLKYVRQENKSDKIDHMNGVSVMAFAQGDVVSMFMEGIDPDYRTRILENLETFIIDQTTGVLDKIQTLEDKEREALYEIISDEIIENIELFREELEEYQYKNYISPIITNVNFLAKDELAEMAETLVNITSYKRKSSMGPETVGGPIDVAVISKGDGFIWVRRKHYFTSEYNHHFFANYYCREGE